MALAAIEGIVGESSPVNGNAADPETVFHADLEKNRRKGRSLFGLLESLKVKKKTNNAQSVKREFEEA